MKKHYFFLLVFTLFLFPFIVPVFSQAGISPQLVDYIFCNSNIITVDEFNPLFEAIAIKDGIIVGLGDTEEILENFATENETTYDLDD